MPGTVREAEGCFRFSHDFLQKLSRLWLLMCEFEKSEHIKFQCVWIFISLRCLMPGHADLYACVAGSRHIEMSNVNTSQYYIVCAAIIVLLLLLILPLHRYQY